ncbi:MAG: LrgB family protein [Clostridia bacterium]|nr:LrgB family protein [Clostridia bacterium]
MRDFLTGSAFFCVFMTIGAFLLGWFLQKKFKSPLLNPILIGAVLVMAALTVLHIPNSAYQEAVKPLSFLRTPATICLALSFYEQLMKLKKHLPVIIVGVILGTVGSMGSIIALAKLFGLEQQLLVSLLPKSVTTAIGVALCEEAGGIPAITTAAIIGTGILGNMLGPVLCKLFRFRHPVAQGVAFGTASHVIGTARAQETDPLTGAVSTLSLTLAGLLTAICFSFVA